MTHLGLTTECISSYLEADMESVWSERGNLLIVEDGFKFRKHKVLADDVGKWCCTFKTCKAWMKLRNGNVLEKIVDHNHDRQPTLVFNRKKLSNPVKRKAVEDISTRPSKLIHLELQHADVQTLTTGDIALVRRNIHNARSCVLPKLPTNLQELHDGLSSMEIKTNNGEEFLLVNDSENNLVCFSTRTNLIAMCQTEIMYVDGTFKSSPKLFTQLFTVRGVINDIYVPSAFFLLPDKQCKSYSVAFHCLVEECKKGREMLPGPQFTQRPQRPGPHFTLDSESGPQFVGTVLFREIGSLPPTHSLSTRPLPLHSPL